MSCEQRLNPFSFFLINVKNWEQQDGNRTFTPSDSIPKICQVNTLYGARFKSWLNGKGAAVKFIFSIPVFFPFSFIPFNSVTWRNIELSNVPFPVSQVFFPSSVSYQVHPRFRYMSHKSKLFSEGKPPTTSPFPTTPSYVDQEASPRTSRAIIN